MSSVSCYFSLIFSSMFAWPHPTRPVFCLSHSAVSLPAGLPPPAAIAKRGLKTRGKATHPVGTHAAHQKKMDTTQINLQSAPHLALRLQTPAETIQKPEQTSISGITLQHHLRLISSFCVIFRKTGGKIGFFLVILKDTLLIIVKYTKYILDRT